VGTFSEKLKVKDDWQATLIELEEVERFNTTFRTALEPGRFRRNIVTTGVRLNDLVGRRFSVGAAVVEGIRLCEPCAHLGQILGPDVVRGMVHRAGLRVRIVNGATIRPGDYIADQGAA
jgi:MOSC domain-containing protein YiiM